MVWRHESTSTLPAAAPKPPRRRPRDLFAIDEQARIVAFAGTPVGRVLIFAIALLAVSRYFDVWATLLAVSAALTAAWLPKYRIPVLLTATWLATFTETLLSGNDFAEHIGLVMTQEGIANLPAAGLATASLLAVVLGIRTLLAFVRQHPKSLLARRPMLAMLGLEALLCYTGTAGFPARLAAPADLVAAGRCHTLHLVPSLRRRRSACVERRPGRHANGRAAPSGARPTCLSARVRPICKNSWPRRRTISSSPS